MAGKSIYDKAGVKPGDGQALSKAVTAHADQHGMMLRANAAAAFMRPAASGAGSGGSPAPSPPAAPTAKTPPKGTNRKMTFSGLAKLAGHPQPDAHITSETRHGHPGHFVHFKDDKGRATQIYSQTRAGAVAVRSILAKGRTGGYDIAAITRALTTASDTAN